MPSKPLTNKQAQRLAEREIPPGPPLPQYEIMAHRISADQPMLLDPGLVPFAAVPEGARLLVLTYREIV